MYYLKVEVEGVGRGLLMNKFSIEASIELESIVKKTRRNPTNAAQEAEMRAYRLHSKNGEKGQLMLPAEHFWAALVKTGSSIQQKGRGKKTYKGAFQGSLEILPDYIGLINKNGCQEHLLFNYDIDSRPVRIAATKGRIIRHRPFIKSGWGAKFRILVRDDAIPTEVVQFALTEAGQSQCVGDYRPRFGQFRIVSCERGKTSSVETGDIKGKLS